MLETRELCKTYKPKKGQPVMAVDHVSLRFPEKGMVFLLGKSGSGKSTMLNLLGGLDQYDDGEIIIKGISSKDFTQQRFDSYRNTYVGFIFQEYNVLEEFTVGANIALALELQGKTATDEAINAILQEVDLAGYGNRKPNELSGGQKQRVAIARALVKNPEIIMADEPTGALDSNTGRQVLDTLKRLSKDKLVIVVSHDREYAEQYADRIIELADGKVIRDVEVADETTVEADQQLVFRSNTIEIPADYHLTEEDRIRINEYIDQLKAGATLTLGGFVRKFRETDTSCIPAQDGSKFNLIKSKLPMKSAFKIGCSSLKHKRFRLVMTILLSVAAFSMFALVDTFSSYNHIRACTDSLIDSNIDYISMCKAIKHGEGLDMWWDSWGNKLSQEDMETLEKETGIDVMGIYLPTGQYRLSFAEQYDSKVELSQNYPLYPSAFRGFVEVTAESIENMGYDVVAGKLPDGTKNEIAVSMVVYETFHKAGYTNQIQEAEGSDDLVYDEMTGEIINKPDDSQQKITYDKIEKPEDLIGKTLTLMDVEYTITGIVDTKLDLSRYESLTYDTEQMSTADMVINYMLMSEYECALDYSPSGAAMVGEGAVQTLVEASPKMFEETKGSLWIHGSSDDYDDYLEIWVYNYTTIDKFSSDEVIWFDGEKTTLEKNEVIISLDALTLYNDETGKGTSLYETEPTAAELKNALSAFNGNISGEIYSYYDETPSTSLSDLKIVGVFKPDSAYVNCIALHPDYVNLIVDDIDGIYESIVGAMPQSEHEIEAIVSYCYQEDVDVRYALNNAVTYELDTVDEVLMILAKVFLYIGIAFAVFAALLMANFITTSISYKKQEIGILRAIGSRSADVFRIFFSESFVIAMINFVLSSLLCGIGVTVINYALRTYAGILVTVLHFGIRQLLLLFVISVAIAAVASFIPVYRIAAKKPIDAIRNR